MSFEAESTDVAGCDEVLFEDRHDWEQTRPSVAIALGLSAIETEGGTGLGDGSKTLADYVDADALDALLTHEPGCPTSITVAVGPYRVWIEGERLRIDGADSAGA